MIKKVFRSVFFVFIFWILALNSFCQKELELLQASEKGDSAKVVELLNEVASPNTAYSDGETALMLACKGNFSSIVKALAEHGALLNTSSENKHTALIYVVARGNLDLTKYLVSKGADASKDGAQLLILASNRSHFEVLKFLIEDAKITVNSQTDEGNYSLIAAVIGGNIAIVRYLIDKGADLNLKNDTKTFYKNTSFLLFSVFWRVWQF